MQIRFVQDVQPRAQTGNEHYKPGMEADLRDSWAESLIDEGLAEPLTPFAPIDDEPDPAEKQADYAAMRITDLRALAKSKGVFRSRMTKADLVAALGE